MKRLVRLMVISLVVVGIFAGSALKVKASASENTDMVKSHVSVTTEAGLVENKDKEEQDGFTFYKKFEQLEYIVYCKGHDGTHTIVYTVNGKNQTTDELKRDALNVQFGSPQYIIYYYEFSNVNVGDVIEYEYSYVNRYSGFPEEISQSGTIVVE